MCRHLSRLALVFSIAALTAPASQASSTMCLGHERCVSPPAVAGTLHTDSVRARVVVPMRADGSQHGFAGRASLAAART
jgi:hypothetical protein